MSDTDGHTDNYPFLDEVSNKRRAKQESVRTKSTSDVYRNRGKVQNVSGILDPKLDAAWIAPSGAGSSLAVKTLRNKSAQAGSQALSDANTGTIGWVPKGSRAFQLREDMSDHQQEDLLAVDNKIMLKGCEAVENLKLSCQKLAADLASNHCLMEKWADSDCPIFGDRPR